MRKQTVIIANAVIWGIVMIACAISLKDTKSYPDIQLILGAGAAISLFVVAIVGTRAP